ncbi:MAG: MFS transporter [Rhodobacteraceae bacterium]|nr:MFS transporter [Paracoccaceae bacterium]
MADKRIGSGFDAFRSRGFASYWGALVSTGFAVQIQTVAVGWQVYEMTRDPLDLGLVGLSQFLPALLLLVVTGTVADRFPRRAIMAGCLFLMAVVALGLMLLTRDATPHVGLIFALMALFGMARAFYNPARQSIVPNLVPPEHLSGAVAVNSTANQVATICGPVAGGLLYVINPGVAFGASLALFGLSAALVATIPRLPQRIAQGRATLETLSAGFRYIWREKVVLGAISLDLFAVLLGGATALLPIYASDVLDIGPTGLGVLRAAPAVGALLMAFYLIRRPLEDHAGRIMLAAVAAFGVFTLVFALSETLWISVLALALTGAADMISMYVRGTLIQLWTPDDVRGRVNAVNQVFIGASNELGAFRAGASAALFGPVAAVVIGGAGTLAVAALWRRWFPQLAAIRLLDDPAAPGRSVKRG